MRTGRGTQQHGAAQSTGWPGDERCSTAQVSSRRQLLAAGPRLRKKLWCGCSLLQRCGAIHPTINPSSQAISRRLSHATPPAHLPVPQYLEVECIAHVLHADQVVVLDALVIPGGGSSGGGRQVGFTGLCEQLLVTGCLTDTGLSAAQHRRSSSSGSKVGMLRCGKGEHSHE